jgi:hypothetical protein
VGRASKKIWSILRDERGFFPLLLPAASLLSKPIVWVSIALLLSLAANATLWTMYKGELRRSGALTAERDSAISAGVACSEGVKKLRQAGEARAAEAAKEIARARDAARRAEARALETLGTAPTVPGDACASAKVMNEEKLMQRKAVRIGR